MSAFEKTAVSDVGTRTLTGSLRMWAGEVSDYPRKKTVARLFEAAAATYPDRVAVISGNSRLTYRELNQRANRLAHSLRAMGVKEETLVGLCVERSLGMIVGILAILKTGGAYAPFDPEYPQERIEFMLNDTHTPVVLTERSVAGTVLAHRNLPLVFLDEVTESGSSDPVNPEPLTGPDSLAYVMYTSGSTGRPKGVLVENHSIVRLVFNTNYCHFGPEEVFLQFAPISFDASTLEIWGALLHGGTLVVVPPRAFSLEQIGQAIREHHVTTMWLTAGLFQLFVEERLEDLRPLQQLLAGGDVLSPRHVQKVLDAFPHLTLVNGYGPTEGTTFTCCHRMKQGDEVTDAVPIGRPISNSFAYLLDENLAPVEPGALGELFAGGDGVARGYLNSPELTNERFLPDPFREMPGARMYRTGDLARWNENGVIEFCGRADNQVKILGHRIEPGEIEAALLCHPQICQACVVPNGDETGNKRLAAYYVTMDRAPLSARELKDFLALKLPPYMVPALYTALPGLPLNPNGKVDRRALPAPSHTAVGGVDLVASSGVEQAIHEIWKRVLHLELVGLEDNFFDLGGDSLLLVAVHSQLQKTLHVEIEVMDLFEYTTIRSLSQHLAKNVPEQPVFAAVQEQAQKQREAFAKRRIVKGGNL
jgi:amino acid adenylation domain-containing protein